MIYVEKRLNWAPVPTDETVEESVKKQLGDSRAAARRALAAAQGGFQDRSVKLLNVFDDFNNALVRVGDVKNYPQVTESLERDNGINCAIRANRRIEEWEFEEDLNSNWDFPPPDHRAVERTLQLASFLEEERVKSSHELEEEKRLGIQTWSNCVRQSMIEKRIEALAGIHSFTTAEIRKILQALLYRERCSITEDDTRFLGALLMHPACNKHPRYEHRGSGCKIAPFANWLNVLCHAVTSNLHPWTTLSDCGRLLERIFERFVYPWSNTNLSFADHWETDVHNSDTYFTQYNQRVGGYDDSYSRFGQRREMRIIESCIANGRIDTLEALFRSLHVDKEALIKVINVRLSTEIAWHTYNPYNYGFDTYPLSEVPHKTLNYLLRPGLCKPAIRIPSFYLPRPPLRDGEIEVEDDWDDIPTAYEMRLQRWDETAKRERSLWARRFGWQLLRTYVIFRWMANWWWDTALRRRYHAVTDEDGRPLMLGSVVASEQTALGNASASASSSGLASGMDALDDAGNAAGNRASFCVDTLEAKKMAAMERNLIAAREQAVKEANTAAAAAKAAAAKVASVKSIKKRPREE